MEPGKKALILVIEDELPLLSAIQKKLELSGFETRTAQDGSRALGILKDLPKPPSLIWLDYYLPAMSGLEFLTKIKADPKLAGIPVFVVSNTAGPDKVNAMIALGAQKYFLKAEKRLEEIVEEIRQYLNKGGT
ncbi:MAG: hypothetical protein A2900_02095 [Candidatus Chisholmbacteria bacterium RIFCSPLOWO2_01_FULL_50_28]|uniref:Response regulatory domain-containing protein n=1 Tax=Candidatus Chisholmbacteria bacterium RIFCSPHIGHO2_01_FULL_52_32 TaxID=1797591 RepID=A0A1G1VTN0_9BACT|nr:MAG: hypothetical protein A2786_04650 [Candidatus Chisholmbacteria bacterium RIFCSPHIGHO2_01_FULL_52_32]OGY19875.1 MAG: hypothetical protein A2900_02095 [Candidatus Chisholmbacteria bacterium RIFCSPLOWO2_01_FULL_50_28]